MTDSPLRDRDLERELRAANVSLLEGLRFEKRLRVEMSCLLTEAQKDECYARAHAAVAANVAERYCDCVEPDCALVHRSVAS